MIIWERLNNEDFKPADFEGFKSKPGEKAFAISPKQWIEITDAIGIKVKSGSKRNKPLKIDGLIDDNQSN